MKEFSEMHAIISTLVCLGIEYENGGYLIARGRKSDGNIIFADMNDKILEEPGKKLTDQMYGWDKYFSRAFEIMYRKNFRKPTMSFSIGDPEVAALLNEI